MNLAVFLPNWIGDAVMATPALRALREHFRGDRLVGVARPYVAGVLEGADWFDELLPATPDLQGVFAVARRLRQLRPAVAVLLPNSVRSAFTAWLGGCRRRIGIARDPMRRLLLTDALEPVCDPIGRVTPSPAIDDYNRVAQAAGCPTPGYRMELFTTPSDEAAAAAVWRRAGFGPGREVICLNPGAAFGAAKHWPADYFAELAHHFAHSRGSGVLVLCGPAESGLARQIAASADHSGVIALSADGMPPPSLGLTKAVIRRCGLLVTTDSGPRHFAAALGRPVVTLFGPTHIAWTETYYPQAIHLQKQVDCGPCQLRVCPLDHRCMRQLLPAEVTGAAEELLAGAATRRAGA
jgi:lipopolysaccharide heptosyltransferase II